MAYGLLRLVLDKVPFVDTHHKPFLVALNKREYAYILTLYAERGVNHEYTYIRRLDSPYGAYHGVVLYVFVDFVLLTYAGSVDKVEVEAEFIVARVYGVAGSAGYISHNIAVLAYKRVYNR